MVEIAGGILLALAILASLPLLGMLLFWLAIPIAVAIAVWLAAAFPEAALAFVLLIATPLAVLRVVDLLRWLVRKLIHKGAKP